jgi:ubiquinone/menaquinone biosynthesis C-methylase UbiE
MAKLGRLERKAMLSERHAEDGLRRTRLLMEHVDLEGKSDYLELGCGGGHVTRFMATECGLECMGTDLDPEMVEVARSRSKDTGHVRFMTADATDLPFEDGTFDLVLSFGILHHIREWPRVMEEVSRVLRPGGGYLLGDIAFSRFSRAILRPLVRNYGVYTVEDLVTTAAEAGLRPTFRVSPRGTFLKYHAIVLEKGSEGGDGPSSISSEGGQ